MAKIQTLNEYEKVRGGSWKETDHVGGILKEKNSERV